MIVVAVEVARNADQARRGPIDGLGRLLAKLNQPLEIPVVVHQPVEMNQTLVDDVLVELTLVFEDYRAAVLVEPKCVDSPHMGSAVFGSEEANAAERFQVLLKQGLHRHFNGIGRARKLGEAALFDAREFDVGHGPASGTRRFHPCGNNF